MTKQAMAAAERQRKYRESRVTLKVESAGVGFLMAQALSKEAGLLWKICEGCKKRGEDYSEALKSMGTLRRAAEELEAHAKFLMELERERQEAELARLNRELAGDCEVDSAVSKD